MSESQAMKDMFAAGAHFGYSKSRRHPTTKPYIYTSKNGNDVIDLEKTVELLEVAESYITDLGKANKKVLFVGTKPEAKKIVRDAAEGVGTPHVTERWVGGTLTNFKQIRKRVDRLIELKEDREKGDLEKYTKKEQLLISQEIERMEILFAGLTDLEKLPAALFVVDSRKEHLAVHEARKKNIPVIALSNTDCDIDDIEYPIVANDGSRSSIAYVIERIKAAYEKGKNAASDDTSDK